MRGPGSAEPGVSALLGRFRRFLGWVRFTCVSTCSLEQSIILHKEGPWKGVPGAAMDEIRLRQLQCRPRSEKNAPIFGETYTSPHAPRGRPFSLQPHGGLLLPYLSWLWTRPAPSRVGTWAPTSRPNPHTKTIFLHFHAFCMLFPPFPCIFTV